MNKAYLSGRVFDEPKLISKPEMAAHVVFNLLVKHHSKAGTQKELFRISAWHTRAEYCLKNLSCGMIVALEGYLTQHPLSIEGRTISAVEVTASEILLPTQSFKAQEPSVKARLMDDVLEAG